tara:strand:- start:255 stop:848 length:594 start_codon:yes stop_codon:yes gene_type:complete
MTIKDKKKSQPIEQKQVHPQRTDVKQISWIQASLPKVIPTEWVFAFFDLPSSEFTRRVRLHRNLKRAGCAMHSQSVYCMPYSAKNFKAVKALDSSLTTVRASVDKKKAKDLVDTYQNFIESVFLEVEEKVEELEDSKATSGDSALRGYTKRLKKMWDRFDHLRFLIGLVPSDAYQERMEGLEQLVRIIDSHDQGKLV